MKNTQTQKFVEDLFNEDELDVDAILNAKHKHPIKIWISYKLFVFGVFLSDMKLNLRLLFKNLFKTNK